MSESAVFWTTILISTIPIAIIAIFFVKSALGNSVKEQNSPYIKDFLAFLDLCYMIEVNNPCIMHYKKTEDGNLLVSGYFPTAEFFRSVLMYTLSWNDTAVIESYLTKSGGKECWELFQRIAPEWHPSANGVTLLKTIPLPAKEKTCHHAVNLALKEHWKDRIEFTSVDHLCAFFTFKQHLCLRLHPRAALAIFR